MTIVNTHGDEVGHVSDNNSIKCKIGGKEIWISIASGTSDTEPTLMLSTKDGKVYVTDACGNTIVSALTDSALYVGVKQ